MRGRKSFTALRTRLSQGGAIALTVVLLALALLSFLVFWDIHSLQQVTCVIGDAKADGIDKAVSALDAVADLSIKLSTALIGLGAAVLIGYKPEVKLSTLSKYLLLISALFFLQSTLYAVWWRMGVAELWLNDCISRISSERFQLRYTAHFIFFALGLTALAGILIASIFARAGTKGGQG